MGRAEAEKIPEDSRKGSIFQRNDFFASQKAAVPFHKSRVTWIMVKFGSDGSEPSWRPLTNPECR